MYILVCTHKGFRQEAFRKHRHKLDELKSRSTQRVRSSHEDIYAPIARAGRAVARRRGRVARARGAVRQVVCEIIRCGIFIICTACHHHVNNNNNNNSIGDKIAT